MKKYSGGNFIEWLLIIVAVSVVIFAIVVPKSVKLSLIGFSPFNDPVGTLGSTTSARVPDQAPAAKNVVQPAQTHSTIGTPISSTVKASQLALSIGNAGSTYQPADEYITIENRGSTSADISGFMLVNGKSNRSYAVGSNETHFASDSAIIPQGARVLSPSGANTLSDIILRPGETAIIVTGSPGNLVPSIVSFKENKCTGYFDETYRFSPYMSRQCVAPRNESGVTSLSRECQDFIGTISTCHTPKFNTVNANGNTADQQGTQTCNGCIDGKAGLTSQCSDFVRSHYSYGGCLTYHSADKDFERSTWRVYLYKPWEMWASSNETISLYDRQGNLVAKTSY